MRRYFSTSSSPPGADDDLFMEVVRPAEKGDEVFNTYGQLGSAALLARYGFCDQDNPHDFVLVSEETLLESAERALKQQSEGREGARGTSSGRKQAGAGADLVTRMKFCKDMGLLVGPAEGCDRMHIGMKFKHPPEMSPQTSRIAAP